MPKPGYLTPSSFDKLMTGSRSGDSWGETAMSVVDTLAMEMLGVEPPDEIDAPPLMWGRDYEPVAIEAYREITLRDVTKAEWREAPDLVFVGGHGDGLVGLDGGVEVKSPFNSRNHLINVLTIQPYRNPWQTHGYIWIYERKWWDFVSYDSRFKEEHRLFVKRIVRDEEAIDRLRRRCMEAYDMALEKAERFIQQFK